MQKKKQFKKLMSEINDKFFIYFPSKFRLFETHLWTYVKDPIDFK